MREELVKFLRENYGDLDLFPELDLKVDDGTELKDVKVVGNDECFDVKEFYQYVLDGDKLYMAYYDIEDEDLMQLDNVDYSHASKIVDVTEQILDLMED